MAAREAEVSKGERDQRSVVLGTSMTEERGEL